MKLLANEGTLQIKMVVVYIRIDFIFPHSQFERRMCNNCTLYAIREYAILQLLRLPYLAYIFRMWQPPLWVSPGQLATPSVTPSLCLTPPKMAQLMSPNLPTVTPPTLWLPSNPAPLTGLRWRLWGRETEQTDRGQRSWGVLLLRVQVRRQGCKHWCRLWQLYSQWRHMGVGRATVSVVSRVPHYCIMCTCSYSRSDTCSSIFWDCHSNSNKYISHTET